MEALLQETLSLKSFEVLAKNMLSAFCQDLYGAMSLC